MKTTFLHKLNPFGSFIFYWILLFLLPNPLFSQSTGDTIVSWWQGDYTPNIIDPNLYATDLTEGPGIIYYDCPGNYVFADNFDQGDVDAAMDNGDYWEWKIAPKPGYELRMQYYEVQRRASDHDPSEVNTLGTLYWKHGWDGVWIHSGITAGLHKGLSNFCTQSSSRRPHDMSDFWTTDTLYFRLVRYIYDNDIWGFNRVTRNGYSWIEGLVSLLPVELTRFEAKKQGKKVLLDWETASELDNVGFEIEQSTDGNDWRTIGFVEGNGTTTEAIQYSFLDENPLYGNNYYRLKQLDLDGKFHYSPIRSIFHNQEVTDILHIFPNPVEHHFTLGVNNPEGKSARVQLFSSSGQVVYEQTFARGEMPDYWTKEFNLPQREMYFVITQVGQAIETKKVVPIRK